jgi:hypothetical protein
MYETLMKFGERLAQAENNITHLRAKLNATESSDVKIMNRLDSTETNLSSIESRLNQTEEALLSRVVNASKDTEVQVTSLRNHLNSTTTNITTQLADLSSQLNAVSSATGTYMVRTKMSFGAYGNGTTYFRDAFGVQHLLDVDTSDSATSVQRSPTGRLAYQYKRVKNSYPTYYFDITVSLTAIATVQVLGFCRVERGPSIIRPSSDPPHNLAFYLPKGSGVTCVLLDARR